MVQIGADSKRRNSAMSAMQVRSLICLVMCTTAICSFDLHTYIGKSTRASPLMEIIKHSSHNRASFAVNNRFVIFNLNKEMPIQIGNFHSANRLVMCFSKYVETRNLEEYGATLYDGVPLDQSLIVRLNKYRIMEYVVIGKSCEDKRSYFQMFLLAKAENVMFACAQLESFRFYTFKAYRKGNCSKVNKIVLLDIWTQETTLKKERAKFPEKKINLNGCRLQILLKLSPPAVMASHNHGLHGWDISILDTAVRHLNGVPHFKITDLDREDPEAVKKSDIVGGMMKFGPRSSSEAIVSAGIKVKIIAVAPKLPRTYLSLFFDVFNGSLWGVILMVCVVSVIAAFLVLNLEKKSSLIVFGKSMLGLPLLVDQPFSRRVPARLSFGFWLLFTFLLTNIYRVGLSTKLTTQASLFEVHTWRDSRLPYHIHCRQTMCKWLLDVDHNAPEDDRLRPFDDGVPAFHVMANLARNKSFLYVELAETVVYSVRHMQRADLALIQILDVPLYSFETAYSVQGSYYLQTSLATVLTRMAETGLTTRIKDQLMGRAKRVLREATKAKQKYRAVRFADVSSIFLIMVGLHGIATAFLLFEWLWHSLRF